MIFLFNWVIFRFKSFSFSGMCFHIWGFPWKNPAQTSFRYMRGKTKKTSHVHTRSNQDTHRNNNEDIDTHINMNVNINMNLSKYRSQYRCKYISKSEFGHRYKHTHTYIHTYIYIYTYIYFFTCIHKRWATRCSSQFSIFFEALTKGLIDVTAIVLCTVIQVLVSRLFVLFTLYQLMVLC